MKINILNIKRILITSGIFILGMIITNSLSAQAGFGYGFRAGLSFSKFNGPLETGPDGAELESYDFGSGFHIGVSTSYKFTDLVGLRGEFIFSQRGTKYSYNGPSYYVLGLHETETVLLKGNRDMELTVTNAYIDIPLSVYYKLGSLEISGGAGMGLNVGSSGGGRIVFNGSSSVTNLPVDEFRVDLNYNYKSNDARQVDPSFIDVRVDGQTLNVPNRLGAYYWYVEKDKNYFKTLDFYLMGGLSLYLNEGLYLGGRVIYGLTDQDRNEYDISHQTSNGTDFILRDDENKIITLQVSIGFSF